MVQSKHRTDRPAKGKPTTGKPDEEPPRIARGPIGIANLVGRITKPALGSRGLAGAELIGQWSNIVGPELAQLATPASLKRERGNADAGGTLLLRVSSSAAATVLQLKGPQIVERVNRFFGYPAVAKLQVVPGQGPKLAAARQAEPILSPESLQEIARNVSDVQDTEIRDALARLGAAVRRRRTRDE